MSAAVAVLTGSARAVQLPLDSRAIEEAIAIGQSRLAAERTRYHDPYRVVVSRPPVDYVDVITPFRRVVLAAQGRAELGGRGFGQREAFEVLAAAPDELELRVELTFHPLNTYIGVPVFVVSVTPGPGATAAVPPRSVTAMPRFGARVAGMPQPTPAPAGAVLPGRSQPMLGGVVIARFDAGVLAIAATNTIVISEAGRELARVPVDLARLR